MAMYPRERDRAAGRVEVEPHTVFRRAFKTNQTSADTILFGIPTAVPPPTTTEGVHELPKGKSIIISPYGTDEADEQFRLSVELWFPIYDKIATTKTTEDVGWFPITVALLDCTLGATSPSAQAGPLASTDYMCWKVLKATGSYQNWVPTPDNKPDDWDVSSGDPPTNGVVGISILTRGAKYVQFKIDREGGTGTDAASGNCLFAVI